MSELTKAIRNAVAAEISYSHGSKEKDELDIERAWEKVDKLIKIATTPRYVEPPRF